MFVKYKKGAEFLLGSNQELLVSRGCMPRAALEHGHQLLNFIYENSQYVLPEMDLGFTNSKTV